MITMNQKFRVIANGVSFFTTKRQILNGVGDMKSINLAVQRALKALENYRKVENFPIRGLTGVWEECHIAVDMLTEPKV